MYVYVVHIGMMLRVQGGEAELKKKISHVTYFCISNLVHKKNETQRYYHHPHQVRELLPFLAVLQQIKTKKRKMKKKKVERRRAKEEGEEEKD